MRRRLATDMGDIVIEAPARLQRPKGALDKCPFCRGNEALTPPTVDREPARGPWTARAFANAYPSADAHEVLVDTPRHVESWAQMNPDEAIASMELARRRFSALMAAGFAPLLFRNDGVMAGASIPHAHWQIVGTQEAWPRAGPPAPQGAAQVVSSYGGLDVVVPMAARMPYELWLRPAQAGGGFERLGRDDTQALARILHAALCALSQGGIAPAWNVVLRSSVRTWRLEVMPRPERVGGFELGSGAWINAVTAQASAAFWSSVLWPG
jgi:UDPglucose--hexose-1-phosphate uridylyltransferase